MGVGLVAKLALSLMRGSSLSFFLFYLSLLLPYSSSKMEGRGGGLPGGSMVEPVVGGLELRPPHH
jgi:hypothetical protein